MANENRLIDATEARKHSTHDIITHFLDRCPTVDAVEVVRCKDCKHLMHSAIYKQHFCTNIYGLRNICISNNDFCSHGERREGE